MVLSLCCDVWHNADVSNRGLIREALRGGGKTTGELVEYCRESGSAIDASGVATILDQMTRSDECEEVAGKWHSRCAPNPAGNPKELAAIPSIRKVSDFMLDLEMEISAIKAGTLKVEEGKVIMSARKLQMRAIEVYLQAMRLQKHDREARS